MDELKRILEEMGKAFAEYRAANDARLAEIEKRGKADPQFDEKLTRIEGELKRLEAEKAALEAKMNRPGFVPGRGEDETKKQEHKAAFTKWVRRGVEEGLGELEKKAVSVAVPGDGGYAVPEVLAAQIDALLGKETPMRGVCRIITVGSEDYRELVNKHGATSGWVGETDARTTTSSPALAEVSPFMGEIYANPEATQKALDDIFFDVDGWIVAELAKTFGEAENSAFTTGDGIKKPKGLLAYPTAATADGARPFGTIQYLKTGVAAAFPASNPQDLLIDVIHAIKAGHRANAKWMLTGLTLAAIRKWKDSDGNYLWQPGLQVGVPSSLLGYPVAENEDMPQVGANAFPVAFGDFVAAYTIVDRVGVRMLRDPFTNKPYVGFYTTKRVGGFAKNTEAVKFIKCEA